MRASRELPDFPWDSLAPHAERARARAAELLEAGDEVGFVDLSVGSPVDPSPAVARAALDAASDAYGYPATAGDAVLRQAMIDWFARRRGAELGPQNVLPTIGSKEFIAGLPGFLSLGPGDVVVHPERAYPTYALGAALVGATALAADDTASWPANTRLVWLGTPGNPDGRTLTVAQLQAAVLRARELDCIIASDECYAELNWNGSGAPGPAPSILDPRVLSVVDGSRHNVLAVYSLSKQSNLAGYRAGIVGGCSQVLGRVLAVRKHMGLIPPQPIQAAMAAALGDDAHVAEQRERYRARRELLLPALERAGLRIDHSEAGLYLWVTRSEQAEATVAWFAERGILVTPGTFYGDETHVRIALSATDAQIDAAAARLSA